MSDFDHGAWARAKAELSLLPLPACGRDLIDRILSGEVISFDRAESDERIALRRLGDAGVIDSYYGLSFGESKQLRAAHERGLIGELFS